VEVPMKKVIITGALGQIGSELTMALRERYGYDNVVATDIRSIPGSVAHDSGPFVIADVTDPAKFKEVLCKHKIGTIYHLAAILSHAAEQKPQLAWHINMNGLYYMLELAREQSCQIFTPSSIGAFGPSTPPDRTPQDTIQRPSTMYGVSKVAGELLCDYYYKRFGVDTRGVRYPGLISYVAPPGGGTTDYAVEIYYEAIKNKRFTCFLKQGTYLDMMYMPDALTAAIDLMEADPDRLKHRNAFNVTAMSVAPEDITRSIQKFIPEFSIDYRIDPVRQDIADSWPNSLDDTAAREEWGFSPKYDLDSMTADMLEKLTEKLK